MNGRVDSSHLSRADVHTPSDPNTEAGELLAIFQSTLGSSRSRCDENGRKLWDRIEAVRAALAAQTPQASETLHGELARRLADEVMAEIIRLERSSKATCRRDIKRVSAALLPRLFGCLNMHAIAHGFGLEYVHSQQGRSATAERPVTA